MTSPTQDTRFSSTVGWKRVIYDGPHEAGTFLVRQGTEGEPFYARFTESFVWRHIDPDVDGDGARELGSRLKETNRLYYLSEV